MALKQTVGDTLFRVGISGALDLFHANEGRVRRRVERNLANQYDDRSACFVGGEMELLTHRNYEKALSHLWKAETIAPYLGFHDASRADKVAAGAVGGDASRQGPASADARGQDEVRDLVDVVRSEDVRKEFADAYSPAQREAIATIMSLLVHGEAYALYTSATLLPLVRGTGAKVGMAMQVMEEAKHFIVLREMVRTIDRVRPLSASGRLLFETIARKRYYHKLFGMNVVLESFATNLFSQFEGYPGLRHIMRPFHMDEARHCAFPQTYAALGNIPDHVTHDPKYQRARVLMLLPAVLLVFDYKPHFEAVGIDTFAFFGRFLAKLQRLADRSGFHVPAEPLLALNVLFNNYTRIFEPDKYTGFVDYSHMNNDEISEDMAARERTTFGDDVFDGLGGVLSAYRAKRAS